MKSITDAVITIAWDGDCWVAYLTAPELEADRLAEGTTIVSAAINAELALRKKLKR